MRFVKPINLTRSSFILDVRSPEEYATLTLGLPHVHRCLDDLNPSAFIKENNLEHTQTINILCHSGYRASQAAEMFEQTGFENVAVSIGGIVEAEYEGIEIVRH